jgi:hypothetical protein
MAVNFAKLPLRLSKPEAHLGEPVYGRQDYEMIGISPAQRVV